MQKRLRIALAGAGNISYHHLIAWQRSGLADVVAVCDPDEGRAHARAAEFALPACYTDYAEMLERESPDAVDIATPMDTHAQHVLAANALGVHALCQKPLCPTLAEARALVDAVNPRSRLMVHENWRFRPWYRRVATWLLAGRLGNVQQVRLSWLNSGLLPDTRGLRPIIAKQPYMGRLQRLMVAEVLIHHLDVLRWLFGPLRIESAVLRHGCEAVSGESSATIVLVAANGAEVLLEGDMMAVGHPARPQDMLEITGERGRISLQSSTLVLDSERPERQTFDLDAGYQASFDAAIAHFVEGLQSGRDFETSPSDNLETLKLVEAVYDASGHRRAGS